MSEVEREPSCSFGGPASRCPEPPYVGVVLATWTDAHAAADGAEPESRVAFLCRRHGAGISEWPDVVRGVATEWHHQKAANAALAHPKDARVGDRLAAALDRLAVVVRSQ